MYVYTCIKRIWGRDVKSQKIGSSNESMNILKESTNTCGFFEIGQNHRLLL